MPFFHLTLKKSIIVNFIYNHFSILVSDSNVGFVLAVGAFTYAGASPLVTIVFKNTERRYVSLIAFTMATFSLLVFGPSEMLRLPK